MNKDIDLTKILKDVPIGTKLYCPLFGTVLFTGISTHTDYPIKTNRTYFTKEGHYDVIYPTSECILFPSKDQRDWSKFNWYIPKKGDYVQVITSDKDSANPYRGIYSKTIDGIIYGYGWLSKYGNIFITEPSPSRHGDIPLTNAAGCTVGPATESAVRAIDNALDKLGILFDKNTMSIQKKSPEPYQFQPFEQVLVRRHDAAKWKCDLYSNMSSSIEYNCVGGTYSYCIPYKGNEYLLGTAGFPHNR